MSSDTILAEMLSDIDAKYDTSKGSSIYDVLNAAAIKFASYETAIDNMVERRFATTATGKDLQYVVVDHGVTPKTSTKSSGNVTITGVSGSPITAGQIVSTDSVNFVFTQSTTIPVSGTIDVPSSCSVYGSIGNVPAGAIKYFPSTITGLQTVTNALAFTNGYDGEDEADLKDRFFEKVQETATSGNASEYKAWAKSVVGVGDAKVFPLWNGVGTVKVVIINSNKQAADQALIDKVLAYIVSVRPACSGTLTVSSATQLSINVSGTLSLESGSILANVKSAIEDNIETYLSTLSFDATYISYIKIGSIILDTEGVLDCANITINGSTSNITLTDTQVAVLGSVTV